MGDNNEFGSKAYASLEKWLVKALDNSPYAGTLTLNIRFYDAAVSDVSFHVEHSHGSGIPAECDPRGREILSEIETDVRILLGRSFRFGSVAVQLTFIKGVTSYIDTTITRTKKIAWNAPEGEAAHD